MLLTKSRVSILFRKPFNSRVHITTKKHPKPTAKMLQGTNLDIANKNDQSLLKNRVGSCNNCFTTNRRMIKLLSSHHLHVTKTLHQTLVPQYKT